MAGEAKTRQNKHWYFARLGFLAIPWKSRDNPNAKGTLFIQCYLLHAANTESALRKAECILSVSENLRGEGKLGRSRVIYRKIGVLNLEPLYQKLESGVELFDETEANVSYTTVKSRKLSKKARLRLIAYEKRKGKPPLLDVYWGEDFDSA